MATNDNKIMLKLCSSFYCKNCDYNTRKKSSYDKHILSAKHIKSTNDNKIMLKLCSKYTCEKCEKYFNDRSGLWRHNKKCILEKENIESISDDKQSEINNNITPELVLNIIHQNQEFKDLLLEQNKIIMEMSKNNSITNINNSNNINSNNKTFNLQVFLNETCKDAMNIMDFVDSIKISLSDIESIGKLGFVNGMSKLIIKNLNALDENMRPVHCNDLKRS